MNEDPLKRAEHGTSERARSALSLRLVTTAAEDPSAPPERSDATPTPRYALADLNVVVLASASEEPEEQLLSTRFPFEHAPVGSAVVHTCMTSNERQSAHGWLFESDEPDLASDRPIGEFAISSNGASSVTAGCPPDYEAVRARVSPPVATATRFRARSGRAVLVIALLITFIVPSLALITIGSQTASSERAPQPISSTTPGASEAAVDLPVPIVLPTPAPAPVPQAIEKPVPPISKAPRPAPAPKPPVTTRPPEKPAGPIARVPEQPRPAPAASKSDVPVSAPARVVQAPRAAPAVETGAQRLARAQALCDERGFVGRAFCREAARWSHCHPDKWGAVPECMVQGNAAQ